LWGGGGLAFLKFDFSLVVFFELVFLLLRKFLKPCHQLMQNPFGMLANDTTPEN
jgi:hypothetical protein